MQRINVLCQNLIICVYTQVIIRFLFLIMEPLQVPTNFKFSLVFESYVATNPFRSNANFNFLDVT
jgi:hypothetical protein